MAKAQNFPTSKELDAAAAKKKRFTAGYHETTPALAALLDDAAERRERGLSFIASEGLAAQSTLAILAHPSSNLYAEGTYNYETGNFGRFYEGLEAVDKIELLAMREICKSVGIDHDAKGFANVQPHSGGVANTAIWQALLTPGDTMLALNLGEGGHLSHGHPMNVSGRLYNIVQYGVIDNPGGADDRHLDYDQMEKLARERKPKVIVMGFSAYSREIDAKRFRKVADEVGAYLVADMSHVAGLIAGGVYGHNKEFGNPVHLADVTMFTTHKSYMGPRGAVIVAPDRNLKVGDKALWQALNSAVFPGGQGGPHINSIAAIADAAIRAQTPEFAQYARQTVANARALASVLSDAGNHIQTGGTDNHLMLVDLRVDGKGKPVDTPLLGNAAARTLSRAGIILNKNTVHGETNGAFKTSGIRLGTQVVTMRGLGEEEIREVGGYIVEVLDALRQKPSREIKDVNAGVNKETEDKVRAKMEKLAAQFPTYEAGQGRAR